MANVLTILPNGARIGDRTKTIRYGVTLSGSYAQHTRGQNVGEVLDLNAALNPGFQQDAKWGNKGPDLTYIINIGNGYNLQIVPGADARHPVLVLYSSAGTEQAAATYASLGLNTDLDIIIEATGRNCD